MASERTPLPACGVATLGEMQDPTRVHLEAIVIDTHADTPQRFVDEGWDFSGNLSHGMLNLETARQGNLAAEFFAIWVEPTEWR
jgi:membrane dipeptidase